MNGIVSAQTQTEATGVEAKDHIAHFYIYYDPNGHQLVVVNEELYLNIVDEDNFLNKAIEDMHNANAELEAARDECLKAIDAASSPDKVNPSAYQRLVARFDAAQIEANKKREVMDAIHKTLDSLEESDPKPLDEISTIKELIPVASSIGNVFREEDKVRYVRPSTAFARATGRTSIEWKEVPIEEKERNFLKDGQFHRDIFVSELRETFSKPEIQSKLSANFTNWLPENIQMKTEFLTKFAENWSKALQYDIDKACAASSSNGAGSASGSGGFSGGGSGGGGGSGDFSAQSTNTASSNGSGSGGRGFSGGGSGGGGGSGDFSNTSTAPNACDSRMFSFSAAAQFLRWTHGVGIKGDFDYRSFRGSIKAEGRAELALLEGKSNFKWQIPDRRGWMLSLPSRKGVNADLGLIRLVFEIALKGFVGATLAGEVSVTVDASCLVKGENGQNDNPAPDPQGNRFDFDKFASKPESNSTAHMNAGVGAFVGAEGTADFSFGAQWKNPEKRSDYAYFAKYLIGVSAQAGAGAQAKFAVGYLNDVGFFIEARAGFCFGYGAKGQMKLSINETVILEFMAWFAYQLRNVDFQYIRELITEDGYKNMCMMQYLLIAATYTGEALQAVSMVASRIIDAYRAHNDRMKLMKRLEQKPDLFRLAAPEVKGNIIFMLTEDSFITTFSVRADNMRVWEAEAWKWGTMKDLKRLVLNLLKYTQSKREYEHIMAFMSQKMGEKGDWKANEKKLLEFFDATEINAWLFQWASTNYDGDFRDWLKTLEEKDRQDALHSSLNFYDQLPDPALRGTDMEQTYLANLNYCNGGCHNYTQPSYTTPEFLTCQAGNIWECETVDAMLAQNTDAQASQKPV